MAELGCGMKCLKYLMFFLNIIFWITGAVLLGVGIWLAVDDTALKFLDGVADNAMDDALMQAGVYTIIAVGALVFLLGFLGCCGACYENSCMLCIYIIIVTIVLIAELVAGILLIVYWRDIDSGVSDEMLKSLREEFGTQDENGQDKATTASWHSMQRDFECCGVNNYTDYIGSKWCENKELPGKPCGDDPVPDSCCASNDASERERCYDEALTHTPGDQLFRKGCREELNNWFDRNSVIFIAVIFTFLGLQIFGVIFACILRSAFTKYEKAEAV